MRHRFRFVCLVVCLGLGAVGSIDVLAPSFELRAVAQSFNDSRRAEAIRLDQQGLEQYQTGQLSAALLSYQQALAIVREIGDRAPEGRAFNNIGLVYRSQGQHPQALDSFQQALAISREVGDRATEGAALSNIGVVYSSQGQYPQALNSLQQALTILREVGDRAGEGTTLDNIGVVYGSQGQYPQALNSLQQALAISREVGKRTQESITLSNIGVVYSSQGQHPQALDSYQQALVISREVGDRAGEGTTLNNIGAIHESQRQYLQALNSFQQALAISREVGDRAQEGTALSNIGLIYARQGQYPQALNSFQQALALIRAVGNHAREGATLNNIGASYSYQGQYPQALNFYQQALVISREVGDLNTESMSLNNIGITLLRTGQFAQAGEQLNAAIDVYESLRPAEMSDAAKVAIFETQAVTYNYLQQALIEQNQPEQALEVAERGRGRALVALLSEQSAANGTAANTAPSIDQIKQIARTQNATLVVYSQIYTVSGDESLYAWVVKPTGEVAFRQTALNSQDGQPARPNPISLLNSPMFRGSEPDAASGVVASTRSSLRVGDGTIGVTLDEPAQNARLQQLHQLLIEPIADLLPTNPNDRVVFVPQGSLFLVPFAALQDADGKYLIEQHTIVTTPSIEVLGLAHQRQQAQTASGSGEVLVVGNPTMPSISTPPDYQPQQLANLPAAKREAETIADFFQTQALTGSDATETIVRQQMTTARIVHLATHGLLDYGNPQATGVLDLPGAVALAPSGDNDGLLTSAEISQMQLNADLVVMSACETGLGDIRGDGVVGLSRSLMQAGVPSVVVSLWSVPDAPTAELMTEFYRQLQQTPDKAQALRQAMLITMQQHPNPRDWAAFTLVGEAQ